MADTKASALTAATSLDSDDIVYCVEDGVSKQITTTNLFGTPQPIGATTPSTGTFTTLKGDSNKNVILYNTDNLIINGCGTFINQRGVSGTVTLSAGVYGHDRWKAGSGGCTYTFATASGVTTITVTAGTLVQVVEGLSISSGTHVLSWTGTAQAQIDGGGYGDTGVTATLTAGTNATVEFGTGTIAQVKLEKGSLPTQVVHRHVEQELALCQRYFETNYPTGSAPGTGSIVNGAVLFQTNTAGTSSFAGGRSFNTRKRTTPTVTLYSPTTGDANKVRNSTAGADVAATADSSGEYGIGQILFGSAPTADNQYAYYFTASCEL